MPGLVKVMEEGPGWELELSGQENQGWAAEVRAWVGLVLAPWWHAGPSAGSHGRS